jgi:predicted nucleotidyltransferase component of viral defense system
MKERAAEPARRNMPASVKARLLALARARGEDFQHTLIRFAIERWLYRLSVSRHADRFVLKGAILFATWEEAPHRPTLDLDLLGYGDHRLEGVVQAFREILREAVPEDGLVFDADSIRGEEIATESVYQAIRIRLIAGLGKAVTPIQIDVGFGDPVTPGPVKLEYPSLLGFPSAKLRGYPPETVVAEKFECLVSLGMKNTRMKDIYDLWYMAKARGFKGEVLRQAVVSTFKARGTPLPSQSPTAFTPEFSRDEAKQKMWEAFLARSRLQAPSGLHEVMLDLTTFLLPLAMEAETFRQTWPPGGPWQELGEE